MTKLLEPLWYASPINLPEASSGAISVRHHIVEAGSKVPIIGWRQALLTKRKPVLALVSEPLRVHELLEDDAVWMTDFPEELQQIAQALHELRQTTDLYEQRVLIGGLGLGIMAVTVAATTKQPPVVVEKNADVIKLCATEKYTTVHDDIAHYLSVCDPFDVFLLDTWRGTNEGTWWEEVLPLRRIIRNRFGRRPKIHCWGEDIMWGQVIAALQQGKNHWYYKGVPKLELREAAAFVRNVGLPAWEKNYGKAIDEMTKKVCAI